MRKKAGGKGDKKMLENGIVVGIVAGVVITVITIKIVQWYIEKKKQNQVLVSGKEIVWDDEKKLWSEE